MIDGGHIYSYYSDYEKIINLNIYDPQTPKFYIRDKFNNINIVDEIKNKIYSIIIIQKDRNYNNNQYNLILKSGYFKIDNIKYNIFVRINENKI